MLILRNVKTDFCLHQIEESNFLKMNSSFVSWCEDNHTDNDRRFLEYDDFLFLNTVCKAYHSGFGYDIEKHFTSTPSNLSLVVGAIAFPDTEMLQCVPFEDGSEVHFNLSKTERTAKNWTLPHKTVILRLNHRGETNWKITPHKVKKTCFDDENVVKKRCDWYQLPTRSSKYNPTKQFVGSFSERPFIRVVDPYEEIKISSVKKGSQITVDDVLFGSRGLCFGPDRSVENYTVLRDTGSTLVLMVKIDNW